MKFSFSTRNFGSLVLIPLIVLLAACGSSNDSSTSSIVAPIAPGPINPNCPPGSWACGGYGNGTVFSSGVGYWAGPTFMLLPGSFPSGQSGYAPQVTVNVGNTFLLSGSAQWGELDFWDGLFGWFTGDDACDGISNATAQVVISYGNVPGQIISPNVPVPVTSYGNGVYFGYNPLTKPSHADCVKFNNLTLVRY